ncbi:MAG: hypothetical protein M1822_004214 [Bathelium mastoideum]|nr:MAG: hypothetical protein M1822_004214 [Bathelium mastoideum]
MAMLSNLFGCFCLWADPEPSDLAENHTLNNTKNGPYQDGANEAEIAHDIVAKLFAAQKHDVILKADLQTTIRARGWYESLAAAVLATLVRAIELKAEMGPAMKDAYGKASTAISQNKEWAGKHPKMTEVIITLIALGILALMMPWLMVYLGFTEDGIFKGELFSHLCNVVS